jgi:hypothetical protein
VSATNPPDMRAAAREYEAAGLCVVPVAADGTKRPDLRSWTEYKDRRSTADEHDQWFGPERRGGARQGIGVVYGRISGNVEMLEFEGRAIAEGILDEVTEIMEGSGLGEFWKSIVTGWATESPSGGLHLRVRVAGTPVKGSTKLASRLAREDELTADERVRLEKNPDAQVGRVLIETRGEGGYGVVEPSHGSVHKSGKPYVRTAGGSDSIPTIDAEHYRALHAALRAVDQLPQRETSQSAPRAPKGPMPGGRLRPGDDFENKVGWPEILTPHGWQLLFQRGTSYWSRPGKERGISATTGHAPDRDRLFVFSTSTEFAANIAYTKFAAYALLNHNEDFKAAARELARQGFGDKPPHRVIDDNVIPLRSRNAPPTDGANALSEDVPLPPEPEFPPQSKPVIDITREAEGIEAILSAMRAGQLPDLYTRAGGLSWIDTDEQGHPTMHELGPENLRAYLHEHTRTVVTAKDEETGGTRDVWELPQVRTCSTILGFKSWPLPRLRGIVTTPVVRPDGTFLDTPGYDKPTGLYMHPHAPLRRIEVPVTEQKIAKAKAIVLDQMLADFPFVQDSDRAHMLGALLTPILRHYFHGPTPMVIITATDKGSGKTLLKDIFAYCYSISSTAWSMADEELRKSITSQLFTQGQPVVVFDNLPNGYVIKSAQLSTLLTAEYWGDRILGRTEAVQMPNDKLWVLTGNALQTGGDNARRAIWVRLEPDCPNPDERDGFVVGDLRPWLRKNASTVVAALVTMVQGWIADGAKTKSVRFGDYSEWASIVAGVLDYLEVPGWLADRTAAASARDAEDQEWGAFLAVWHDAFKSQPTPAGKLFEVLGEYVPQPNDKSTKPVSSGQHLGRWLGTRNGRYFGTYKLIGAFDTHAKQNLWRVEPFVRRTAGGAA